MSYRLRVYAPLDARYSNIIVLDGNVLITRAIPQGESVPCYDGTVDGFNPNLMPGFNSPEQSDAFPPAFHRWVVNVDGYVSYQTPTAADAWRCVLDWTELCGASNVWVRLELIATETYYATLTFDANGGYGAPDPIGGSETNTTGYLSFPIPATTPTRPGYAFAGWNTAADGSGNSYQPGGTFVGWGATSPTSQPTHTLYAVWTEIASGVTVRIYNGGWADYIPMIYDNGWHEYEPNFSGG